MLGVFRFNGTAFHSYIVVFWRIGSFRINLYMNQRFGIYSLFLYISYVIQFYHDQEAPENTKKVRFELHSDKHGKVEPEVEDKSKCDDMGSVDEFEGGGDMDEESNLHDENLVETYDYEDDDYGYDGF